MPRIDFNGDGRGDIMWSHSPTERVTNWLGTTTGSFVINDGNASTAQPAGEVAAVGDFNGDGRTDTLWRDGQEYRSSLTGVDGAFAFQSLTFVGNVTLNWQVVGTGDFNADGRDDLLWLSSNGQMSNWLSNGNGTFTINDAVGMSEFIVNGRVAGIGDFNNDGRDDVIVQNGTINTIALGWAAGDWAWEDGARVAPVNWEIVGVGDFDGNGRADLLWRNTATGAVSNWLQNGGIADLFFYFAINDANAFANVPLEWQIIGINDYNGDGRDDILWRNSVTGDISDWLATSTGGWTVNDANARTPVPLEWSVVPPLSSGYLFEH